MLDIEKLRLTDKEILACCHQSTWVTQDMITITNAQLIKVLYMMLMLSINGQMCEPSGLPPIVIKNA